MINVIKRERKTEIDWQACMEEASELALHAHLQASCLALDTVNQNQSLL